MSKKIHYAKLISLLLTLSLGSAACAGSALSSRVIYPSKDGYERFATRTGLEKEIESLVKPVIASGESTGVSVGILNPDGEMKFYGYGKTDNPGRVVPDENTVFEIGSVSKLFVLTIYSSLVNEGVISGNMTVRELMPKEVALSRDISEITLNELATHTAGFPRELYTMRQCYHFIGYLLTGRNLYDYIDKKWLYDYMATAELKPRDKRGYVYSNLGISILSHLVVLKTGKPMYQLAEERIFKPLGMKDTAYRISDVQRARLASGHSGDQPLFVPRGSKIDDWDMGEVMYPTGGFYSTTKDLLIFMKANLGIPKSPLTGVFEGMQKLQTGTPIQKFALGWSVDDFDSGRIRIFYKHGMVAGYSAYVGFNPDSKTAVVTLYNSFNWSEKIGHNLMYRLSYYSVHSDTSRKITSSKKGEPGKDESI